MRLISSIYVKLFLAFIIVLTPLYTIGLIMIRQSAVVVNEKLSHSMISKIDFFINQLEIEFRRITEMEQAFFEDEDLNALSLGADFMSDLEKMQAIKRVKKRLELLDYSSSYIAQSSAWIPSMDRVIHSKDSIDSIDRDELSAAVAFLRQSYTIMPLQNKLLVSRMFPDSLFLQADKMPLYIISTELSRQKLRQVIDTFSEAGQGGAILVDMAGNWEIGGGSFEAEARGVLQRYRSEGANLEPLKPVKITVEDQQYLVAFQTSEPLGATLITYVPAKVVFGLLQKYNIWLWLLSALSIIIVAVFSRVIYLLIHRPLKMLISAFKKMESGNLNVAVTRSSPDEFRYLYDRFNQMAERVNVLVHEVYEQKYLYNLAELRQLQSQINPHFLYNSLFIMHRMAVNEDYEGVTGFTKSLGHFYRFITRSGAETIPLKSEMDFVRTYMQIQTVRFDSRITVEIVQLPVRYENVLVPRLIVQPLVENAYNHGLENTICEGHIRITYGDTVDYLLICVEDNGDSLHDDDLLELQLRLQLPLTEQKETTGLINIHRRMQLKYGAGWGLSCRRSGLGGLCVEIRIPIEKE